MTNKDRWLSITDSLCSPQNFVEWSYRYIIASSLQRRVACNADPKYGFMPTFPNMYCILFGEPGIGKSVVLDVVSDILKHHKKKDFTTITSTSTDQEKVLADSIQKANQEDAEEAMVKLKKGGEKIEPVLFPYASDATTYEALVESMSKAGRRINFNHVNGDGITKLDIYFHCSMYFCLDELGSLFRKNTDSVINYLLGLYGCPLDYEYKTKTRGEDRVRRGCLNFLAGTTPDFMEDITNDKLIGKGFTARCFFICATKNRKNVDRPVPLMPEQVVYKQELLAHIKKLAGLYGEVQIGADSREWIKDWWNNSENNRHLRPNKSPKLAPYYARKNIHLYKVAMAEHFGESTEMFIPLEVFQRAAAILDKEELTMHLALTTENDNPLAKLTKKVLAYIGTKKQANMVDLIAVFWDELPAGKKSMEEVLTHLQEQHKISYKTETDETTHREIGYYIAL